MKRLILPLLVLGIAASLVSGAASPAPTASPTWWAGVWQTSFGVMKIKQAGATVTARYGSAQTNTITGTVNGATLTGTWKEASSGGKVRFVISSDGASFKGVYGNQAEPPTNNWTGTIVSHAPKPKPGGAVTTTTKTTPTSTVAVTPSNFAGVWQTSFGVMKIKQTGSAFTARYGSAQTNSITGTVTGRTMRGTWKEASSGGKVYFTISTDGASFKGAYGNGVEPPTNAWTGTKT